MSKSDGKIYITISDERNNNEQGNVGPNRTDNSKTNDQNKENDKNNFLAHKFKDFALGQTKQFVNYTISNIGNFQGDFQAQREIQNTISIGDKIFSLGIVIATGNYVGAAFMAATTAINYGYEYYSGIVQTNQQNRSIEQLAKLSGLSTLSNGSR